MKLLYITNGINGAGGLERVLSVKASYFAEEYNYDVTILVLNNAHQNPFYQFSSKINFQSVEVKGVIGYLKTYKFGIQKVVDFIKPDVISVCDDGFKGFFLPLIIRTEAKWIYERHVSKLVESREDHSFFRNVMTKIKWRLMESLAKKFSRFILLTEENKKEWTSLNNVEVISNPLSFYPEESSDLNSKVVICVGKISYQKGQDLLVKAWEKVHDKYPDWQLHLYGKENLMVLNTDQLTNNIHYFPPAKDIEQKYLQSSIYVMSSRFEGFGMVLIEAMACGVPCVSFNCDYGPSDIIMDNVDGFIVEKENVHLLAEKINTLITDNDLRNSFGKRAKINVARYKAESIAKQWDKLFKNL
jgi:glycosyltransferase involved in cell wall biosynthesis